MRPVRPCCLTEHNSDDHEGVQRTYDDQDDEAITGSKGVQFTRCEVDLLLHTVLERCNCMGGILHALFDEVHGSADQLADRPQQASPGSRLVRRRRR